MVMVMGENRQNINSEKKALSSKPEFECRLTCYPEVIVFQPQLWTRQSVNVDMMLFVQRMER